MAASVIIKRDSAILLSANPVEGSTCKWGASKLFAFLDLKASEALVNADGVVVEPAGGIYNLECGEYNVQPKARAVSAGSCASPCAAPSGFAGLVVRAANSDPTLFFEHPGTPPMGQFNSIAVWGDKLICNSGGTTEAIWILSRADGSVVNKFGPVGGGHVRVSPDNTKLYISQRTIKVWNLETLTASSEIGDPKLVDAASQVVESDGFLYSIQSNQNSRVVVVHKTNGEFVREFGTKETNFKKESVLCPELTGLAVWGGEIFVGDRRASRIAVFTLDGTYVRCFALRGKGPGFLFETTTGCDIFWVKEGLLFACDNAGHVAVFNCHDGSHVAHLGDMGTTDRPQSITISDDNIVYIINKKKILQFNLNAPGPEIMFPVFPAPSGVISAAGVQRAAAAPGRLFKEHERNVNLNSMTSDEGLLYVHAAEGPEAIWALGRDDGAIRAKMGEPAFFCSGIALYGNRFYKSQTGRPFGIKIYRHEGFAPVTEYATEGRALGQCCQAWFMWVSDDVMFVSEKDSQPARVSMWALDGAFIRQFGHAETNFNKESTLWKEPRGICAEGDNVFVADNSRARIAVFNKNDGAFVRAFGKKGKGPGEFTDIWGIAIKDGLLFACDEGLVQVFNAADGTHVANLGDASTTLKTRHVHIAADGTVYVAVAAHAGTQSKIFAWDVRA